MVHLCKAHRGVPMNIFFSQEPKRVSSRAGFTVFLSRTITTGRTVNDVDGPHEDVATRAVTELVQSFLSPSGRGMSQGDGHFEAISSIVLNIQ